MAWAKLCRMNLRIHEPFIILYFYFVRYFLNAFMYCIWIVLEFEYIQSVFEFTEFKIRRTQKDTKWKVFSLHIGLLPASALCADVGYFYYTKQVFLCTRVAFSFHFLHECIWQALLGTLRLFSNNSCFCFTSRTQQPPCLCKEIFMKAGFLFLKCTNIALNNNFIFRHNQRIKKNKGRLNT